MYNQQHPDKIVEMYGMTVVPTVRDSGVSKPRAAHFGYADEKYDELKIWSSDLGIPEDRLK